MVRRESRVSRRRWKIFPARKEDAHREALGCWDLVIISISRIRYGLILKMAHGFALRWGCMRSELVRL